MLENVAGGLADMATLPREEGPMRMASSTGVAVFDDFGEDPPQGGHLSEETYKSRILLDGNS